MSPSGGYQGDHEEGDGVPRRLTDEQIEQLLAGNTPANASSFEDVASFVAQLAASAELEIPENLASDHISRAAAAAGSASDAVPAEAPSPNRVRRLVRRLALSGLFSSVTAKLVLGTAVALATTAGAAAAGILPDPIQAVAADAASVLGIDIPDPDDLPNDDALTVAPDDNGAGEDEAQPTQPISPADDSTVSSGPTEEPNESESEETDESEGANGNETGSDSTELTAPLVALTGDHQWTGVACDGTTLSVTYRVGEDGSVVVSSTSPAAQVSDTDDGFKVGFPDTEIKVELEEDGVDWTLSVRSDQSCGDDQEDEEDQSDSQDEDSEDEPETGDNQDDESDSNDNQDDESDSDDDQDDESDSDDDQDDDEDDEDEPK